MGSFYDFYFKKKIIVQVPDNLLQQLDEATNRTVGNFTAYRHQPHTGKDEMHGVCDLPGGYEVSWTKSGKRRHEGKFPQTAIPKDAKEAVANVLGVSPDILEGFTFEENGESFLLIEVRS